MEEQENAFPVLKVRSSLQNKETKLVYWCFLGSLPPFWVLDLHRFNPALAKKGLLWNKNTTKSWLKLKSYRVRTHLASSCLLIACKTSHLANLHSWLTKHGQTSFCLPEKRWLTSPQPIKENEMNNNIRAAFQNLLLNLRQKSCQRSSCVLRVLFEINLNCDWCASIKKNPKNRTTNSKSVPL